MSVPNLPGFKNDSTSWLERAQKGFHASSQAKSTENDNIKKIITKTSSNGKPTSLLEIKQAQIQNLSQSLGENHNDVTTASNGRKKGTIFTDSGGNMMGLMSGDGAFAPPVNENMKSVSMAQGAAVPLQAPQVAPYVKMEKQVLRFFGYYIEANITRKIVIHYYLDNNDIEINLTNDNEGVRGGSLYRKQPLNKPNGEAFQIQDFFIGNVVKIVGQELIITDADDVTREFFKKKYNINMSVALDVPKNPVSIAPGMAARIEDDEDGTKKGPAICSGDYFDRKKQLNKELKYLTGDARVLRFSAIKLIDPNTLTMAEQMLGADSMRYSVTYFLIDDTIEIKLVKQRRASTADQTTLLKRGKLAINWHDLPENQVFMSPKDLIVGQELTCYGRKLLLLDCDKVTREIYNALGTPQPKAIPSIYARKIPTIDSNNKTEPDEEGLPIGREDAGKMSIEESRAKLKQREEYRGKVLKVKVNKLPNELDEEDARAAAARVAAASLGIEEEKDMNAFLAGTNNSPNDREFYLFYFLEDDTIQIYEEVKKNSGLPPAGNFLKKGRYLITDSSSSTNSVGSSSSSGSKKSNNTSSNSKYQRYIQPSDLELGNILTLNGFKWLVEVIDVNTIKLIQSIPVLLKSLPSFDVSTCISSLLKVCIMNNINIQEVLARYDKNNIGVLSRTLFVHAMDAEGIWSSLTLQQRATITTTFSSKTGLGGIYYYDLCDELMLLYMSLRSLKQTPTDEHSLMLSKLVPISTNSSNSTTISNNNDTTNNKSTSLRSLFRSSSRAAISPQVGAVIPLDVIINICNEVGITLEVDDRLAIYKAYALDAITNTEVVKSEESKNVSSNSGGQGLAVGSAGSSKAIRAKSLKEVAMKKPDSKNDQENNNRDDKSSGNSVYIRYNMMINDALPVAWC